MTTTISDLYLTSTKAAFEPNFVYVTDPAGYPAKLFWSDGSELPNPLGWDRGKNLYWWGLPGEYLVRYKNAKGKVGETTASVESLDAHLDTLYPYASGEPFYVRTAGGSRSDAYTIDENHYRALRVFKGDVAMDLGAHIGTFARMALQKGASFVSCYEPEEMNCRVLRRNLEAHPTEVHQAAISSSGEPSMTLYVNTGKCSTIHSAIPNSRRVPVQVPIVDFQSELARLQPQVVKCDIEGGEYFLNVTMPDCVEAVAMEIHLKEPGWHEKGLALVADLESQGFVMAKPVKLDPAARTPNPIFHRGERAK